MNNNENLNHGHNTDIGLDNDVIHSHTDKSRCISGSVLHEIPEFYTCHQYGCTHAVDGIR